MQRYYPSTSSGVKTTSAQITTIPAMISGILLDPPTTGMTTLTIYDSENSTTTGKLVLAYLEKFAGESSNQVALPPVIANRGVYCELSAPLSSSSYLIYFTLA